MLACSLVGWPRLCLGPCANLLACLPPSPASLPPPLPRRWAPGIVCGCIPAVKGLLYSPHPPLRMLSEALDALGTGLIPTAIPLLGAVLYRQAGSPAVVWGSQAGRLAGTLLHVARLHLHCSSHPMRAHAQRLPLLVLQGAVCVAAAAARHASRAVPQARHPASPAHPAGGGGAGAAPLCPAGPNVPAHHAPLQRHAHRNQHAGEREQRGQPCSSAGPAAPAFRAALCRGALLLPL